MIKLPEDLTEFLAAKQKLVYPTEDCECGQIKLLSLGKHKLGEVWVNGESLKGVERDPNEGKEGYYAIPAVNLVKSCEDYDPEHILSWIPEENLYISWDSDHWTVTAFPRVTWSMIAANPLPYVNAQWDSPSIGTPFVPWPKFPFKEGMPF